MFLGGPYLMLECTSALWKILDYNLHLNLMCVGLRWEVGGEGYKPFIIHNIKYKQAVYIYI